MPAKPILRRKLRQAPKFCRSLTVGPDLLQGDDFTRYVIEPTRDLVSRLKKKHPGIPIIGFPREAGDGYAPYIRQTGIDALSIDQKVDLDYRQTQFTKRQAVARQS